MRLLLVVVTGYYLLDNPPARKQFYPPPRANPLTGGVAIHTSESVMDTVGVDTGAENVAAFIARRTDNPGSYHAIVDSDSTVMMLPDDYTAFQVGAAGHNSRTYGIALACKESELDADQEWTQRAIDRAAVVAVGFWQRNGFVAHKCARWITSTLVDAGLFNHGDAQPWDRSDAFVRHPQRARLQQMFVDAVLRLTAPDLIPPEEDMPKPMLLLRDRDGHVWLCDRNTKVHVPSGEHVNLLLGIGAIGGDIIDNRGPDSTLLIETLGTLPNGREV